MCDIAPLGTECIYEEYKYELIFCATSHLYQAFNNLWLQIPIVKHFVTPYHCPYFEIKRSDNNT